MENICSGTYAAMRVNAVSGERAKVEDRRIEIGIGYDDKIEVRLEKRNNRCKQLAGAIESGH
jgi:hypothetical protein